jgi:dihydrofolate reductase
MLQNPNNTLQEVRKAYRLLFEYQTRVLDLIGFIGGSFNYDYNGGYSKFSNGSPNNGKGNLNLLAWDWLSMYFYQFNFVEKNKITFAVFLVNDTGYFQVRKENKMHRTNVSAFDSVENSKTKLIFVVGKNTWDSWGKKWDDDNFILDKEGQKISDDKIMLFKSYLLDDFFDEENAIKNLKDFENYCKSYDVNFKYNEKTV